jgi:flagellar basal body-associated protein FliL
MNKANSTPKQTIKGNNTAVIDVPLYLLITIIIGLIALGSIFSMMILPTFFTPKPIVTATPLITTINQSNETIHYHFYIHSEDHQPITNAHIIIKNTDTIATNTTNKSGQTTITVQPTIPRGLHETYFDVIVKPPTNQRVTKNHLLKVILRG